MNEAVIQYHFSKQFDEAISLLNVSIENQEANEDTFVWLGKCYEDKGDLENAIQALVNGLSKFPESNALQYHHQNCESLYQKINHALEEIEMGQHTTSDIQFIKDHLSKLIQNKSFEVSINSLHKLAVARQAKTTNILWIGHYLKDLYFHPEIEPFKPMFDKLLLEEIIFYYLKACKLYEKGYNIVRQDIKALRESAS